jgi:hypothetical protein
MADEKEGINFIKGTGTMDCPMQEIMDFLGNEEYKTIYDDTYKKGHRIEVVNSDTFIEYFEAKTPAFISNRDF